MSFMLEVRPAELSRRWVWRNKRGRFSFLHKLRSEIGAEYIPAIPVDFFAKANQIVMADNHEVGRYCQTFITTMQRLQAGHVRVAASNNSTKQTVS